MMWNTNKQTDNDWAKDAHRQRPETCSRNDLRCQSRVSRDAEGRSDHRDGPLYISSPVDLYPY